MLVGQTDQRAQLTNPIPATELATPRGLRGGEIPRVADLLLQEVAATS